MITLSDIPRPMTGGKFEISLKGLSTDTKPTATYKDIPIANGSTFMEINTKKLFYYDEDSDSWT